jgi:hypothetical protein
MYKRKAQPQPRIEVVATAQTVSDPAEGISTGTPTGVSIAAICVVFVVLATLLLTSGPVTGGAKGIVTGLTRKGKFRTSVAVFPATTKEARANDGEVGAPQEPTENEGAEPWEALGISRREWLRRKLKGKQGASNVIEKIEESEAPQSTSKPRSQEPAQEVKILIVEKEKDTPGEETTLEDPKSVLQTELPPEPEEVVVDDATTRDLPPYAASNSFYHQKSYKCKPLGRLEFDLPQKILVNGSLAPPTGGFPAMTAMQGSTRRPSDDARHTLQLETNTVRYGSWSMSWPPFFRPKHKEWFSRYEIANWRRST